MIDLSVIIVNYNVEYFLEQCLYSVFKAAQGLHMEVWVVDNNSVDGSVAMVREKFPEAKLIANKENLGFSKANNMAIRMSTGRYVLLLNPDTLVEEDTFEKSVQFMDAHPEAGGLGIRMIDGRGQFLPESKRGLPTPAVAFYKIFGLSALFPKSRIFGRYHLGYLPENENHEVDVLSGAYMLMRRSCLDQVGLLDEAFFMYGEDIDLSYRITQGGFKNYYLADARIIHYKGESTKKSSINYVFVFYRAMVIFAEKHFSSRRAGLFSLLINIAIYLRAALAVLSRFVKKAALPVFDFLAILAGLLLARAYYEDYSGIVYDDWRTRTAFVGYTLLWIGAVYASSGYERPTRYGHLLKGLTIGTLVILVLYSLLPEDLRFSRALILIGAAVAGVVFLGSRYILHLLGVTAFSPADAMRKKVGIVAGSSEYERIHKLLTDHPGRRSNHFRIAPLSENDSHVPGADRLQEVVEVYKPHVLVFSGQDMASQDIIGAMASIESRNIEFKIAPPESLYIIGSNSVEKGGELFIMDINAINTERNRRAKRLFDSAVSLLFLITFPLGLLFVKNPGGYARNCVRVLRGHCTWVGYAPPYGKEEGLPPLAPGVLNPMDRMGKLRAPGDTARKLNAIYARDYSLRADVAIIGAGWKHLGRSCA